MDDWILDLALLIVDSSQRNDQLSKLISASSCYQHTLLKEKPANKSRLTFLCSTLPTRSWFC
jgi:hypothetical protein